MMAFLLILLLRRLRFESNPIDRRCRAVPSKSIELMCVPMNENGKRIENRLTMTTDSMVSTFYLKTNRCLMNVCALCGPYFCRPTMTACAKQRIFIYYIFICWASVICVLVLFMFVSESLTSHTMNEEWKCVSYFILGSEWMFEKHSSMALKQ